MTAGIDAFTLHAFTLLVEASFPTERVIGTKNPAHYFCPVQKPILER
jgi:hypothetical protein